MQVHTADSSPRIDRATPQPHQRYIRNPNSNYGGSRLNTRKQPITDCIVCESNVAKYKFKCCLKGFCSSSCYKVHVNTVCPGEDIAPKPQLHRGHNAKLEEASSDEDHENDDELLTADQVAALNNNKVLKEYMRSQRLCDAIRRIDEHPDKLAALTSYMGHPQFHEFVEEVLHTVTPDTYGPFEALLCDAG